MANDKYKTRVGINVIEKVISLKEQDQEFLTNKTILSWWCKQRFYKKSA